MLKPSPWNLGAILSTRNGTWTIRTLDDSDLVSSDPILFYFVQFGPRKVRSELTKRQMVFRSKLTKGQMDFRSELVNA